jgi:hypothetical protein
MPMPTLTKIGGGIGHVHIGGGVETPERSSKPAPIFAPPIVIGKKHIQQVSVTGLRKRPEHPNPA